jgi:hypothetical protein
MSARVRRAVGVVCLLIIGASLTSCGNSSPSSPTPITMTVTGTVPTLGQASQLTATITLTNGTKQDVTSQATWSSSNPPAATISSSGLLTVASLGIATITATYQGISGTLSVSLQLTSVAVTGPTSLTVGQQYQFTATATFSDSSTLDVTTQATWSTNGAGFLRVSSQGLATALAAIGSLPAPGLNVSAFYQGRTGQSAPITVVDSSSSTSTSSSAR